MLIAWPFITIGLFVKLPHKPAIIVSILAGYMLLPVRTAFEIPVVIDIDKATVVSLSAFVAAYAFAKGRTIVLPRDPVLLALMAVFILSPLATAIGNRDPMVYQIRVIPGMSNYDALGVMQINLVTLMPFILGYAFLRGPENHRLILGIFVGAALIYTLPMLVEMRLSPQLHYWLYGFFPHSFGQQMRGSGFRPVVFLGHGLVVAIFACMAVIAAAGLSRFRRRVLTLRTTLVIAYLAIILILCRSFGAIFIGLMFVPLAWLAPPRLLRQIALVIGIVMLCYPVLRQGGVMGGGGLDSVVASISVDRAASLDARTSNEETLLAKLQERPWFGWGSWGRNRIYEKGWGTDLSITDGGWIMRLGSYGYVGYLAMFGLLCFGLLGRHAGSRAAPALPTVVLMLVLCANLVDLLPNSSLSPLTWLLAGAICPGKSPRRRAKTAVASETLEPQSAPERELLHARRALSA